MQRKGQEFLENTIGPRRVVLISEEGRISAILLPRHVEGRHSFNNKTERQPVYENDTFLFIEAQQGQWIINCLKGSYLLDSNGQPKQQLKLTYQEIIEVFYGNKRYILFAENDNTDNNRFSSYTVEDGATILIGRNSECDICYHSNLISREHASLTRTNSTWTVRDEDSVNGVFLNNNKITESVAYAGDVIYMMGFRIILGLGFISLNGNASNMTVSPIKLHRATYDLLNRFRRLESPEEETDNDYFNRSPRKKTIVTTKEIDIEAPPMSARSKGIPTLLRMGSSMLTGGTAALAGNYSMLLSSVLFPFLTQRYTDKEKQEYEENRNIKYTKYLEDKAREIEEEKFREAYELNKKAPATDIILDYSTQRTEHLWERTVDDDDFLVIKVGNGSLPLLSEIKYPTSRFSLDEDDLEDKMYQLAKKPVILNDVPITIDLKKQKVVGITGNTVGTMNLVLQMAIQTVMLHSYDEVKILFLLGEEQSDQIELLRYVPHVWSDSRDMRFIATNSQEAYQIGDHIKKKLEIFEEETRKTENFSVHYVVFALSRRMFDSVEILKSVLEEPSKYPVSILTVYDEVPKECTALINMTSEFQGRVSFLREPLTEDAEIHLDSFDEQKAQKSIRTLSSKSLRALTQSYTLPKSYTFLEMFSAGRTEHLNILQRWENNNPSLSLAAPVGVSTDGDQLILDLHQKYHGPHGLVAGTTGSGKSEFLITYILSLAVNFHPDEVAFVLIDYKGGGLTGAFDDPNRGIHLPHLIGTITNLDGATIQRSLISIESEVKRRQRVFSEAISKTSEGTIDIYSYQRLYRNGILTEPMPHLFIICDEFAELKQQRPEFLDQLVSISRIGRSLGIHLILATQRPTGIVNDQIRSNTKFRVCLKVQDKSDSSDILNRPEAAELKEPGRFYLQVGNNEQFSLGQSGWSGAQYYPQDTIETKKDDSVQFVDNTGQNLIVVSPETNRTASDKSQMIAVVEAIIKAANDIGYNSKMLWNPPLPDVIDAEQQEAVENQITAAEHITVTLGLVDDPEYQDQFPFVYDFTDSQNLLIVGEQATGKSVLLHTILRSIVNRYTPEQFQFYVLDYSTRLFRLYKDLPHCGNILQEEDSPSLETFFRMIQKIISERKRLFSDLELDDYESVNRVHPIPLIMLMIDGYSGLSASKEGDSISYRLRSYISGCSKYGIKLVIAARSLNEIPSQMKGEMGDRIAFRLHDKYEYREVLEVNTESVPADKPGRGMCSIEGRGLEFQALMYDTEKDEVERIDAIRTNVDLIAKRYKDSSAAIRLPVADTKAEYRDFSFQFKQGRIPLGFVYESKKAISLPLKQFTAINVYFGNPQGIVPVSENLLFALKREKGTIYIVKKTESCFSAYERKSSSEDSDADDLRVLSETEFSEEAVSLAKEIKRRKELANDFCTRRGIDPEADESVKKWAAELANNTKPMFIFFEDFREFLEGLDLSHKVIFNSIVRGSDHLNVYYVGCFYPTEDDESDSVMTGIKSDCPTLLFGGRLDRQDICELPETLISSDMTEYNVCLMQYHYGFHTVIMPCGEIATEEIDEDELDIFSN